MEFSGKVILGHQIGRHFGIATANLAGEMPEDFSFGIYLVKVCIEGFQDAFYGLLHYGPRKTFGEGISVEVHLFDFDQNLYSKEMRIEVIQKLREVMKFENADALFSRIEQDVIQGKKMVLRHQILDRWKSLSLTEKSHYKAQARLMLQENALIQSASCLLLYAPDPQCEIEGVLDLMEKFPDKKYAFPRIEGDDLIFHFVQEKAQLLSGKFGILAPEKNLKVVDFEDTETFLCLVPALALDSQGFRLGRGKGYYDRFLSKDGKGLQTLSLVPDFAFFSQLPHEAHDQKISKVIAVCPFSC